MTRIFSTLAVLSTGVLITALWLGFAIQNASDRTLVAQQQVTIHFLTAVGAIVFAVLVHALVITYFMGTGRWLEETCNAYRLGTEWQRRSKDLKWRLYPAIVLSLTLLIVTGGFGAASDPASAFGFRGWGPLSAAQVHMTIALVTLAVNAIVNTWEFMALHRNGLLVGDVLQKVRTIRVERGLPV